MERYFYNCDILHNCFEITKSCISISPAELCKCLSNQNKANISNKACKDFQSLRPDETYDFLRCSYETHGVIIEIPDDDKLQVKVVTQEEGKSSEARRFDNR